MGCYQTGTRMRQSGAVSLRIRPRDVDHDSKSAPRLIIKTTVIGEIILQICPNPSKM